MTSSPRSKGWSGAALSKNASLPRTLVNGPSKSKSSLTSVRAASKSPRQNAVRYCPSTSIRVLARVAARCTDRKPVEVGLPAVVVRAARVLGQVAMHEAHERCIAVQLQRDLDGARSRRHHRAVAFPTPREHHPIRAVDLDELAACGPVVADLHPVDAAGLRIELRLDAHPEGHLVAVHEIREDRLRA